MIIKTYSMLCYIKSSYLFYIGDYYDSILNSI